MIIVMHAHASPEEVQAVVDRVGELGLKPHLSTGTERTIIGAIGEGTVASQYQGQFIIGACRNSVLETLFHDIKLYNTSY